jgi:hypothetical protein
MNIVRCIALILVLCISPVALSSAADGIHEDISVTIIGDSAPIIREGGSVTIVHPNEDGIPNIQTAILRNMNDDILNDSVDLFTNPKRRHKSSRQRSCDLLNTSKWYKGYSKWRDYPNLLHGSH